MKKSFEIPFILHTSGADPTSVIGGGTGQGGLGEVDPTQPMSFDTWKGTNIWQDYDDNGNHTPDLEEYALWWLECEFSMDDWDRLNPGVTWPL